MASANKTGIPAPGGGTTVSFGNTPQAGDDNYSFTEDQLLASSIYNNTTHILSLDVMSNDLGGAAKTLWSIDDGNGHTNLADYDLLSADTQGHFESAAVNNLGVQDQIAISNGKIQLDITNSLAHLGVTDINNLGAGEVIDDTFVYAIRLANGTLSQATVSVHLAGSNDAAHFGDYTGGTGVTEDGGSLVSEGITESTAGAIAFSDADFHDTHTASVETSSNLGVLQITSVDDTSTQSGPQPDGAIQLSYSVGDDAIDYLSHGETRTESFTVDLVEHHPDSTTSTVTTTLSYVITGTNDTALLAAVDVNGSVIEDSNVDVITNNLTDTGSVTFNDVDHADSETATVSFGDAVGTTGGATVSADLLAALHTALTTSLSYTHGPVAQGDADTGAVTGTVGWTFAVDNDLIQYLNSGQSITVHYNLSLTDDSGAANDTSADQVVTIVINGADEGGGGQEPGNEPPVAHTDNWIISQQTDVGADIHITPDWFTQNDTDPENDALFVTNVTLPGGASLTGNWTPNYDVSGHHLTGLDLNNLGGTDVVLDYTLSDGTTSVIGHVNITSQHITGNTDTIDLSAQNYDFSWVDGRNGDDTLTGGSATNVLAGGAGNDTLVGGLEIDTLIGNSGNDVFVFSTASGSTPAAPDVIADFIHGDDHIDLTAIDAGVLGYGGNTATVAAHTVNWVESGGNTVVTADINGDTTADFEVVLTGTGHGLTGTDFLL
jgi:hypothetical protein